MSDAMLLVETHWGSEMFDVTALKIALTFICLSCFVVVLQFE